jgi:hypothetical protein
VVRKSNAEEYEDDVCKLAEDANFGANSCFCNSDEEVVERRVLKVLEF